MSMPGTYSIIFELIQFIQNRPIVRLDALVMHSTVNQTKSQSW